MSIPSFFLIRSGFVALLAFAAMQTAQAQSVVPGTAQPVPQNLRTPAAAPVAEADLTGDALLRLVVERGLVPPLEVASQGVRQVRDVTSELVFSALNYLGVRYRRGGSSAEEGFDCSGFVRHVVGTQLGLSLPRRSDEQASSPNVFPISKGDLQPGDLVFFNTLRSAFSHVGIYIGDGKFVHSPRTGYSVRIEDMKLDYWVKRFDGARRLQAAGPSAAAATSPAQPSSPAKVSGQP
jgi:cell wall-associated NlpC family hydrolase